MKKIKQFLFFVPIIFSSSIYAQNHGLGALILPDTEYAKLPRPNWDTLRKYSNPYNITNSTNRTSSGVSILRTPPIGD